MQTLAVWQPKAAREKREPTKRLDAIFSLNSCFQSSNEVVFLANILLCGCST